MIRNRIFRHLGLLAIGLLTVLSQGTSAQIGQLSAHQNLARDIYKELIEINTTHSVGSTTEAAEAMAKRLKDAGFPAADVQVLGPHPRKGNLVARLRGTGARKPVLLLAHLDVVEAQREDWSVDPFKFLERDGYFYGRGTSDDKDMAAIWIANLIRYKQEGFTPDRDIIVCLTADEEGGSHNGVRWLVTEHRPLIDAEFCLNEGGRGHMKDGKRFFNAVQVSEKISVSLRLKVTGPGGHSSRPLKDNAIYNLAEGLTRLAKYNFPVELNEVTRVFFERMSAIETGQVARDMKAITRNPPAPEAVSRLSEDPYYNALMRTTYVATMAEAGHASNALPQTATAVINCRLLPGESAKQVRQTIISLLANSKIQVSPVGNIASVPPSPMTAEIMRPIERITEELWPGVPVVPTMSTGATDGRFLRRAGIPTYGVSGLFIDEWRAHGKDERALVQAFYEGQEFLYRLVTALSNISPLTK